MISNAAETMDMLYRRYGSRFKPGNPDCYLYYITTGTWAGDVNLEARRVAVEDDLRALQIFRKIEFSCIGASGVQNLYRQTKNKVSKEFIFANRTLLPEIDGVTEAYLGYVPFSEFMSIVKDDDDNIIHSIFYDNVRDWQDYNDVNSEIRNTLQSHEKTRFVVMNNGVTIIARSMRKLRGDKLQIEDFQVVNGCQTSHVLFDQRGSINDSVSIPLRLIATSDDSVINSIVRATNRQTKVDEEQFFALTEFAEKLESYFQTFQDQRKLYYERRSRQYAHLQLQNSKITTHGNLVRAVASMFLEIPHQTTRSYKSLKERIGRDMFVEGHRLEPYYVAAFALYRLETYFKGIVDTKLKPARFHVLLAVRILSNPAALPRMNSHDMDRYCNAIMQLLWDNASSEDLFKRAADAVAEVAAGNYHRDNIRTQPFTDQIMRKCGASIPARVSTT